MSIGELARPITIYWDLTPAPSMLPDYAAISEQVSAIKPLQLQLFDNGCDLSAASLAILGHFRNTPIAVTLTAKATALASSGIDVLKSLGVRGLLLHVASHQELTGIIEVLETIKGSFATGIAFAVTNGNWRELPLSVRFCLDNGISSLTLPMQRLYGNEAPFMLTCEEQSELAGLLAGLDLSGIRLTIHDPFLWRIFHPSQPFPGGGCQAANTMLAIAPDGVVYPCPALPLALGCLADTTLKRLLDGEAKSLFRRTVTTLPEGCCGCSDQEGCHGGCRGRSQVVAGDMGRLDPACGIEINEKG